MQKLLAYIALALTLLLSLATRWFGFAGFLLWYWGAVLFIGTLLVLALLRLVRRTPGLRALALPLTMILLGAIGVLLSAWSSRPAPPIPERVLSTNDELKYIYDSDLEDRFTGNWMIQLDRDRIRLQRIKAIYRAGQITEPLNQYQAAIVYQHAACADDFQVAYELDKAAASQTHSIRSLDRSPPL